MEGIAGLLVIILPEGRVVVDGLGIRRRDLHVLAEQTDPPLRSDRPFLQVG